MVYFGWAMQILRNLILSCGDFLGFALRKEAKPLILKDWLGDLDSNQDSQIQSLESYQLDDLPAEGETQQLRGFVRLHFNLSRVKRDGALRQLASHRWRRPIRESIVSAECVARSG
jgi:hypothetical protein